MIRTVVSLAFVLGLVVTPAWAHPESGAVHGLAAGFAHPLGGLDHVLAMIAVGLLAVQIGQRAIWQLPAAFIVMMVLGGTLAMIGVPVPLVETGIVGSVIILGLVVAFGGRLSPAIALGLVGAFAVFHGFAHGGEMPLGAHAVDYAIGFVLATALLHVAGVGGAVSARRAAARLAPIGVRVSGGAIAASGLVLAAL